MAPRRSTPHGPLRKPPPRVRHIQLTRQHHKQNSRLSLLLVLGECLCNRTRLGLGVSSLACTCTCTPNRLASSFPPNHPTTSISPLHIHIHIHIHIHQPLHFAATGIGIGEQGLPADKDFPLLSLLSLLSSLSSLSSLSLPFLDASQIQIHTQVRGKATSKISSRPPPPAILLLSHLLLVDHLFSPPSSLHSQSTSSKKTPSSTSSGTQSLSSLDSLSREVNTGFPAAKPGKILVNKITNNPTRQGIPNSHIASAI